MRVLAYLVTIVATTALTLSAVLLVGLYLREAPGGLLIATAAAAPFLVIGPLVVASWATYFADRTPSGRSSWLRSAFLIVVAIVSAAAVVVVIASLSARAPWWVPTILVGGSAVLLALARPLGGRFRRTEVPIVDLRDQILPGPDVVRRKVAKIGATFVIAALVTAVGVTVLNALDGSQPHEAVIGIMLAGQLTLLATAFAAIIVALPFSHLLRDTGGRDIDRLRRYAKLVLRGKGSPAAADEQPAVVRYAEVVQLVLQFNLAYAMLLYISIAFQLVSGILRGSLVVFSAVFLALMVGVVVWLLPRTIIRIRCARRYVQEHRSSTEDQQSVFPLP